jgi:hypothetical protein
MDRKGKRKGPNAKTQKKLNSEAVTLPMANAEVDEGDLGSEIDMKKNATKNLHSHYKDLDAVMPSSLSTVDNISDPYRQCETSSGFTGSVVDYCFLLQKEVEESNAEQLFQTNQQAWLVWLEIMFEKHKPFSENLYPLFRKICEGKLRHDQHLFKLLCMYRMVERGKLTKAQSDKLASEHVTIEFMYKKIVEDIEARRKNKEQEQC